MPPPRSAEVPRATADYYRRQQRIIVKLLTAIRLTWRRMDPRGNWQEQYDDGIGGQLLMLTVAAQVAATRDADSYMADVLNELAFGPATEPGVLVPTGIAGATGDGRPVETLLAQSVVRSGQTFNRLRSLGEAPVEELPDSLPEDLRDIFARELEKRSTEARERVERWAAEEALAEQERWLQHVAASTVIDTARAGESAAMVQRPWVEGYVRMLNPPSCSRCVVLAGKFYLWNEGFSRHEPTCDCRHIPASQEGERFGSLLTNPNIYFDSLSRAEQDEAFGKANAQAIRDGADISQVVNAQRGMKPAQVFGHDVLITSEGTTRRGFAFSQLSQRGGTVRSAEEFVTRQTRRGPETRRVHRERAVAPRLMPESLYEIADGDRDEAIRLLKAHGYIY